MNILDIILPICLIPFAISGFSKGFIKQLPPLVSIIIGTWLAFHFSNVIAKLLHSSFGADRESCAIIAFVAIIVIVFILLSLLAGIVTKMLKALKINWLNKTLGVVFALINACLILGIVATFIDAANIKWDLFDRSITASSNVYCFFERVADIMFPYLKQLFTVLYG